MLVLLTLGSPVAVLALLFTLQWYEYRWLGRRKTTVRPPGEPRQPS